MNDNDQQNEQWEGRVRDTARNFSYPTTPDIASTVSQRLRPQRSIVRRRWVQAAALILLALAALMGVPEIRAAVFQVFHIGSVTIFSGPPTSIPTPPPIAPLQPRPTPVEPTPIASVLDLPDETTFVEALAESHMAVQLPTYPSDLGPPNRVFLQRFGGPVITLVWTQPDHPTQVRLVLQVLDEQATASKFDTGQGQPTVVDHRPAYWLPRVHEIIFWDDRDGQFRRMVNASVLDWMVGRLTYRLESDLTLEEAVQVAESLQ